MENDQYEYGAKIKLALMGILFFGIIGAFLVFQGMENEKGLIINHMIELSPNEASGLYFLLSGASFLFAALALAAMAQSLFQGKTFLIIYPDRFTVPKSLFQKEKNVYFSSIKAVKAQNVSGTKTLTFQSDDGKVCISNRSFKNEAFYQEAIEKILQHCNKT